MQEWRRRVRGALGLALTWAVGGAFLGFAIEMVHNVWPNPLGSLVDIWPAALGYPAFFGGLAFSAVLGIAARRRRFDELSLPKFAAWGAVGGLLVSLIPAAMVTVGLASLNVPVWQITAALAGPLILGTAVAAAGSLALARMAEDRVLRNASRDLDAVGLTDDERRELATPSTQPRRREA
jgi:uncharacterized membrane protein YjfL (UPF0719 family)